MNERLNISVLNGCTIHNVTGLEVDSGEVIFETSSGTYRMDHDQWCCESVYIEDLEGDSDDLIGGLVISAEERTDTNQTLPEGYSAPDDSWTWTFYDIQTTKGHVWIRWLGSSNGYYGEEVDFVKIS